MLLTLTSSSSAYKHPHPPPRSDWSRGGHVIQDGGAHVSRDQKIVVWEKFPHLLEKSLHVREKFPAHTLIL
ncbi:hypothetical protein J6590_090873 [Homalodisca vitripennis]|nr:hypothetical protein J6590_090873 [Homalodisca vitripennis]